jgi:AraC-like DNA-binding protein
LKRHTMKRRTARRKPTSGLALLPTASGGIARAAYTKAVEVGIDTGSLLEESGLTPAQIKNARVRISVRSQVALLNRIATALDDDFLGFELANFVDLRTLGLLYYILTSSDSLGVALARVSRYSAILNEGVRISCRDGKDVVVTFDYVGVARVQDRHQIEFFVTILLRLCRELTRRRVTPKSVELVHRRSRVPAKVRALFDCEIEFGARQDRITFPATVRPTAIVDADPYLNALLLEYCEDILAKRRIRSSHWRTSVENAIAPLLPHGEAHLAGIAQRLGVSRRTLARRLAAENVRFGDVLSELRRELARKYLNEPGMQIAEIAWLLGYKDTSAFSHAFKQWSGASPSKRRPR